MILVSMVLGKEAVARFWMHVPPREGETLSLAETPGFPVRDRFDTADFRVARVRHRVTPLDGPSADVPSMGPEGRMHAVDLHVERI